MLHFVARVAKERSDRHLIVHQALLVLFAILHPLHLLGEANGFVIEILLRISHEKLVGPIICDLILMMKVKDFRINHVIGNVNEFFSRLGGGIGDFHLRDMDGFGKRIVAVIVVSAVPGQVMGCKSDFVFEAP